MDKGETVKMAEFISKKTYSKITNYDSEEEDFQLNFVPNIIFVDENINKIYDFNKVDKPYMRPKKTLMALKDRYHTACYLTSNLNCEHFLKNIKNREFKMEYYDSPFHEFHVQGLFFQLVEKIEIIDVDLNLDFFIHLVENKISFELVTSIVLRRCNIDEDMLGVLCPDLENAYSLTLLDISENPIGDNGFKNILSYLYDWTSLKTLILVDTQLTTKSFEALGSLYAERRIYLTKLDLSRNLLNKPLSVKRLFSPMNRQKPPLEIIVLNHCGLEGSEIALHFYNYLKNMKKLQTIDLSFNLFREEDDILPFGQLLMESHINTLNLSFNLFRESSILSLFLNLTTFSPRSFTKTLVLEHFSMPRGFLNDNPDFVKRKDFVVKHAGERNLVVAKVDELKVVLLKRFNYVYKKDKPKKDMVVETIKQEIPRRKLKKVKCDDFKDALLQIPSEQIEPNLIQEVVAAFTEGNRANALEFICLYEELFPCPSSKAIATKQSTKSENISIESSSKPNEKTSKNSTPNEPIIRLSSHSKPDEAGEIEEAH